MQVRFEPLAEQVRKAFVEFTAEEVRAVTDREAVELAKTVRIPGGYVKLKAKLARVKQLPALREQIRFRALESLVQKAAEEGLRLLPFETIGRPEVEHLPELRSLDGGVTVELLVEEKPRPETLRYDGLTFPPREEVEVSTEDVDQALEEEEKRLSRYEDADESVALADEDLALVRVSVHREGQAIEVPGTESLALRVGEAEGRSPAFRKEISALLRGRHKGEEGELDFDWPTGEGEPEAVAGTRVRLHWVISLARGKVSPKLTDDLVKEITQGRETSILAYRGMLRERLKEQKEESTRAAHREKVFAALVEANPLPLPGRMLQRSVDERWENLRKRIEKGRAPEPEDWEAFEATSRAEAREEIIGELRRSLLVAAVMEAEKIEPDMASISERAEALMGGMGGLDQKDPKSRNFLYSVLTHLTNRDVEDRVYQRIVGGPPPAPAAPSPAAEQEEPGHA